MGTLRWTRMYPETRGDLDAFLARVAQWAETKTVVGIDSETTGLDIYSATFRLRMVQFGTPDEAWLVPAEAGEDFREAIRHALRTLPRMVAHNAPFDALVFDRHLGVKVEDLWPRLRDTRIYAHLIDSRKEHEGGIGLGLKPLAAHYLDPNAEDGQKDLVAEFRKIGHTKDTGWRHIPLDNPVYQRYAGADAALVSALFPRLVREARARDVPQVLIDYEHRVARIGAVIRRKGMLVDGEYTTRLVEELKAEAEHYASVAAQYGVTSVNSPKQVGEALTAMGETLTERTASGQIAVGKEVLMPLADLNDQWERIGAREPNVLADAVLRSKRAGKWAASYASAMLAGRDADGYIHPSINTMGARTARWSVSDPPLQQLPSSDWRIRRCITAPPGMVVAASDFAQVELRVLVALAGAESLAARINAGEDLHTVVTRMVHGIGPEVTDAQLKNDPRRKQTKTISLGKAYVGGVRTLARQTGLPVPQVKAALAQYDRALPEIPAFSRYLTQKAQREGMTVRTPSGRTLRLDRDKSYTAIAYLCQSTARDILGQALCNIEDAGLLDYVFGVVHDEILIYAPEHEAEDVIKRIGECMDMPFFGVEIASDPEVYGPTWGHGYGAAA